MKFKKSMALLLSYMLLFSFNSENKTRAMDPVTTAIGAGKGGIATSIFTIFSIGGVIQTAVRWVIDGGGKIRKVCAHNSAIEEYKKEVQTYGGYRDLREIVERLEDIIAGKSPIKIYGQLRAKQQCFEALSGSLARIMGTQPHFERRGNVVYIIGASGTGKTTMSRAIANAFLRSSGHACYFVECSQINRDCPLGEQLFRTVNQIVNLRDKKEKIGWAGAVFDDIQGNLQYPAQVAAPILEHLFKWNGEVVIVIDEYEKMKKMCKSAFSDEDDKSADEILKSIVSNGYYMAGTEKVDCTKALFIVTTNETREKLESDFGQDGLEGGGAQRLNIIEFEKLDKECSRSIIDKMVADIKRELTGRNSIYRLKDVHFSEETLSLMAGYIVNNQTKQARAKEDLWDKIFALILRDLKSLENKTVEIIYSAGESIGEVGSFSKRIITSSSMKREEIPLPSSKIQDFSETVIRDYSESYGEILDYAQ